MDSKLNLTDPAVVLDAKPEGSDQLEDSPDFQDQIQKLLLGEDLPLEEEMPQLGGVENLDSTADLNTTPSFLNVVDPSLSLDSTSLYRMEINTIPLSAAAEERVLGSQVFRGELILRGLQLLERSGKLDPEQRETVAELLSRKNVGFLIWNLNLINVNPNEETRRKIISKFDSFMAKDIFVLSQDELKEMVNKWINLAGIGVTAYERMFNSNLRLARKMVYRFKDRYNTDLLGIGDMVQFANIGLMKAAARFDPRRGFKFNTFSTPWIIRGLIDGIMEDGSMVNLPKSMQRELRALKRRIERQYQSTQIDVTAEDVLQESALSPGYKELMKNALMLETLASLNTPIDEEDPELELEDVQTSPDKLPEDEVVGTMDRERFWTIIAEVTTPEQLEALMLRYVHGLTQEEARDALRLKSRQVIDSREERAYGRLRKPEIMARLAEFLD